MVPLGDAPASTVYPVARHWRAIVGLAALTAVACATPILAVDDAAVFDGGEARLVAFAQEKTGWVLRGVSDAEVQFLVDGREVATATTDERGFAKVVADVGEGAEKFDARASFEGAEFEVRGRLFPWRRDRVILACDIDATISDTSLGALFFDDLDETSAPIDGSVEALQEIHREYNFLYVTARPRFTLEKTRRWLDDHGYPRDPIITSLTVGDALSQTKYKTRAIKSLRKYYRNIWIGIGNTNIDADSYGVHGMLAVLVQPDAGISQERHVVRLQSWTQIGRFFRDNREVLSDPQQVQAAARGEVALVLPSVD